MAVGGLTSLTTDHATAAIRMALAMLDEAAQHEVLGQPLQLRIGINSGPAVGGVIGTQRLAFDLWGDTVNVASRLQELAAPGRILVGERTMRLARDEFAWEALGETAVASAADLRNVVANLEPKAKATLKVDRGSESLSLELTPASLPTSMAATGVSITSMPARCRTSCSPVASSSGSPSVISATCGVYVRMNSASPALQASDPSTATRRSINS